MSGGASPVDGASLMAVRACPLPESIGKVARKLDVR
jgi:hypothetical protein